MEVEQTKYAKSSLVNYTHICVFEVIVFAPHIVPHLRFHLPKLDCAFSFIADDRLSIRLCCMQYYKCQFSQGILRT